MPCPFYNMDKHKCSEVDGVKKIMVWGIGIIITIFVAAFGYFAHNQSKTNDLLINQTSQVVELKAMVRYQVLPMLPKMNEKTQTTGE